MSINLETLILELQANTSGAEKQVDQSVNRIAGKLDKLEKSKTITPKVDLNQLHSLNELLDVKQKHLFDTIKYFKDNPIVTYYEESGESSSGNSKRDSRSSSQSSSYSVEKELKNQLITKSSENTLDFLDFASAPLKSVMTGVFEGVGNEVSKVLGKGLVQSVEKSLDLSFKDIGSGVGEIVSESLKGINNAAGLNIKGNASKRREMRRANQELDSKGLVQPKANEPEKAAFVMPFSPKSTSQNQVSEATKESIQSTREAAKAVKASTQAVKAKTAQDKDKRAKESTQSVTVKPVQEKAPKAKSSVAKPESSASNIVASRAIAENALRSYSKLKDEVMRSTLSATKLSKIGKGAMVDEVNSQLKKLKSAIESANVALAGAANEPDIKSKISGLKGNLTRRYNSIVKMAKNREVDVDPSNLNPDSLSKAQSKRKPPSSDGGWVRIGAADSDTRKQAVSRQKSIMKAYLKTPIDALDSMRNGLKSVTVKAVAPFQKGWSKIGVKAQDTLKKGLLAVVATTLVPGMVAGFAINEQKMLSSTMEDSRIARQLVKKESFRGLTSAQQDAKVSEANFLRPVGFRKNTQEVAADYNRSQWSKKFPGEKPDSLKGHDAPWRDLKQGTLKALTSKSGFKSAIESGSQESIKGIKMASSGYIAKILAMLTATGTAGLGLTKLGAASVKAASKLEALNNKRKAKQSGGTPSSTPKSGRLYSAVKTDATPSIKSQVLVASTNTLKSFTSTVSKAVSPVKSLGKNIATSSKSIARDIRVKQSAKRTSSKDSQATKVNTKSTSSSPVETPPSAKTGRPNPVSYTPKVIVKPVTKSAQQKSKHPSPDTPAPSGVVGIAIRLQKRVSEAYAKVFKKANKATVQGVKEGSNKVLTDAQVSAQQVASLRAKREAQLKKLRAKQLSSKLNPIKAALDPKGYAANLLQINQLSKKIQVLEQQLADPKSSKGRDYADRKLGKTIHNKTTPGMSRQEGDMMRGEAFGMGASIATMYNPALPVIGALAPLAIPLMPVLAAGFGVKRLVDPIVSRVKEALLAAEPTLKRFEAISGKEGGREDVSYASGIAEEYKVSTKVALDNYARLKVAANRTKLEGAGVKDLFEGITASSRALRLSTFESGLVFNAYTQMLSKGKISMEELRQQLGEKFPPAMGVFASAMGVSIQELNTLSSKGALLSEEVLPKVAKVLMKDFGDAAKSAGNDFLGSVTLMENATFRLDTALSDHFGGMFAGITKGGAKMVDGLASNLDTISKLAGAGLIGVTAQVAVGLQTIMGTPKLAAVFANLQSEITRGFAKTAGILSPFMFGMLIDVMDGWLGAENSIFDNMAHGVSNAFIGAFGAIDNLLRDTMDSALFGAVKGVGGDDVEGNLFSSVTGGIGKMVKILPSGLVELGALMVMFEQVSVLGKMLLSPMFKGLSTAIKAYAKVSSQALLSSKNWKQYFRVMFADSTMAKGAMVAFGIAAKAAVGIAILSFARGDFSDPLITSIQKAEKQIKTSVSGMKAAFADLKKTFDADVAANLAEGIDQSPLDLESKGMEWNLKKLLGISENSTKTDDIILKVNASPKLLKLFSLLSSEGRSGKELDSKLRERADEYGASRFIAPKGKFATLAQTQVVNQAQDLTEGGNNLRERFTVMKLTKNTQSYFMDDAKSKALKDLNELDARLGELGKQRFALELEGTPEAKSKIVEIREEIRSLFLQRQESIKPFAAVMSEMDDIKKAVLSQEDSIEKSNLPRVVKQFLSDLLDPQKELVEDAMDFLEEQGMRDVLSPLGDSWASVSSKLKDAETAFDNIRTKSKLENTNNIASLYDAAPNSKVLSVQLDNAKIANLAKSTQNLANIARERKIALEGLLSIPQIEENEGRKKEIEALRKELTSAEQELASSRQALSKATYDAAKKLRDFKFNIPKLQLRVDRTDLEARKFNKQFDRTLSSETNPKLQGMLLDSANLTNSANQQVLATEQAFKEFNKSLIASTRGINLSIRSLSQDLVRAGREAYNATVTGFGTYAQAANIEDLLGLNKLTSIISKAASVTSSNQTQQLINQKEDKAYDFGLMLKEQQTRKASIIRQTDQSKFNVLQEQKRSNLGRDVDIEGTEFSLEDLKIRARELNLKGNDLNRDVMGTNLQAQEYGLDTRIGSVDTSVDLSMLESNPQQVLSQIQDVYKAMDNTRNQMLKTFDEIKAKGLAVADAQISKQRSAHNRELSLIDRSITAEKNRISQANKALKKELEGTLFAFSGNLKDSLQSLSERAHRAKRDVKGIFQSAKLTNFNPLKDAVDDASNSISKKIADLEKAKRGLSKLVELSNGSMSKDRLIGLVSQGKDSGDIDKDIANQLMDGFSKATSSEDFQAVLNEAKEGVLTYERLVASLQSNRGEVLHRTAELFKRPQQRRMEDLEFEKREFALDSNPFQGMFKKEDLKIELKSDRLEKDLRRSVQDLEGVLSPKDLRAYAKSKADFHKDQIDRARLQATLSFKMLESASQALESTFSSFLKGFGEIFFNDNQEQKKKAKADEMIAYGEKLEALNEKYANDPDLFLKAKENLDLINNSKLDGIKNEFSTIKSAMDLAKEGLLSFVKSMLDSIAQIAAKEVAAGLIGGIFGAAGGGGGLGSLIGGVISGFSDGGTVGGNSTPSVGGNVGAALAKEGKDAQVAVVHKGEEILSTRNGDAQFARALKQSGQWEQMKNQTPNFANGGTVGAGSYARAISSSANQRSSVSNYNSNVVYNLQGNSNELRQSVGQIEAERQRRMKRQYDRNR